MERPERVQCLETLYGIAKRKAARFGLGDASEDFASQYVIRLLEGKSQHQLLNHALIDFIRMEINQVKRLKESAREALYWDGTNNYNAEDRAILFDIMKKCSTPLEEKMLYMYLVEGYTLKEIGELFVVTESRISQRFTAIADKAKRKARHR